MEKEEKRNKLKSTPTYTHLHRERMRVRILIFFPLKKKGKRRKKFQRKKKWIKKYNILVLLSLWSERKFFSVGMYVRVPSKSGLISPSLFFVQIKKIFIFFVAFGLKKAVAGKEVMSRRIKRLSIQVYSAKGIIHEEDSSHWADFRREKFPFSLLRKRLLLLLLFLRLILSD